MLPRLIGELILPPACLLVLSLLAYGIRHRHPKIARFMWVFCALVLYGLSIPLISHGLTNLSEREPALAPATVAALNPRPEVIVVLGAGAVTDAPEYLEAAVPSETSLKRLTYAAYLARATHLPVLASGGYGDIPAQSEGEAMAVQLRHLGVDPVWTETESQTTFENAVGCAELLRPKHLENVLLVTSASHASRAKRAFVSQGFHVAVAPTGFRAWSPRETGIMAIVPSSGQFDESVSALRALLAEAWYLLK